MNEVVNYLDIRHKIGTFTVINCEHRNWIWRLIGHTAVVYKCRITGQLMVLESTNKNFTTGNSGVQLTPLGLWLKNYPGKVFIRVPEFVNKPSNTDAKWNREEKAGQFVAQHLIAKTSYPDLRTWSGRFKVALSALDLKFRGKDLFTYKGDDVGIFCTMLVVQFYIYCGLMKPVIEAAECEPDDTRTHGFLERQLVDCAWSDEIRIK